MTGFDRAFDIVVALEGGLSDDPADPGGLTKFGISHQGFTNLDIAKLTMDQAKRLYLEHYWFPAKCDRLPWPLALLVFDAAVNQGAYAAAVLLQKALGVRQDGAIGPRTLAAAVRADQRELCALFLADRALRYTGTRNFDRFGRGWLKRLFRLAAAMV